MLNTPVTTVDNGGAGLKTSVATRMCLWSPVEDLMWPVSPPSTRGPRTSSLGDPEPVTSPSLTTSSSTVITPPTRTLRVAKWVGDLEDGSDKNQDMNISMSEENQDDEDSPVKDDVDLAKGTGFTLNTGRHEVEDVTIQTEPNETEDDEMVVDVDEPITTSDETSGMTIDVDKQGEETKLPWMPESITEEYVEEELDVKEMSEDQHELSKDTKVEIETNKDPNQQKEAGDLKTQPVTITPWPSYISSHRGEVEDTEDIFAWPSSPTYQLLPGKSVLASTIPWIEVIPNNDAAKTSNMVSEEEGKPGIEVTSDDDASTIPWIETIPSNDVAKIEAISDDDASTIPWIEARANNDVAEANNMVSEEEGKPGIEVISDDDVVKTNRMDSEEEGEREARETGEQDEDSEVETTKAEVRSTYVAIRKLRLPGLKLMGKALKQKQKKKMKKKKTKWIFETDREDKDWKPPRSRRKRLKAPARIKLVKRRPISDDEDEMEQQNYRQPLQRRAWAGATLKTQSEIITFYKSLQKLGMKEGKRMQEKRMKEEGLEARSEVMTTATPVSEVREEASPGRQRCLRDSGSDDWAGEELAGGRSDERERWESLEVDLEKTKVEVKENRLMERPDRADSDTIINVGDTVDKDTEKDSRKEQSPSREEKDGHGGETDSKEKDVRGREADSPGGCPGEGGSPGGSRRTTEEGKTDEKAEEIKIDRSPSVAAATEPGQDMASNSPTPSARIVCVPCLLRQRASGEVEGPAREVRARSAEEQPSEPDQEISRGLSLR